MALSTFTNGTQFVTSLINSNFRDEESRDANIRAGFRVSHQLKIVDDNSSTKFLIIRPRVNITKSKILVRYDSARTSAAFELWCFTTKRALGQVAHLDVDAVHASGVGPEELELEHDVLLAGFTYALRMTQSAGTWADVTYVGYSPKGKAE